MAKKKKAKPVTQRVVEHRQRMTESGFKQINVTLDGKTIAKLDKQAKSEGTSRAKLISRLIQDDRSKQTNKTSSDTKSKPASNVSSNNHLEMVEEEHARLLTHLFVQISGDTLRECAEDEHDARQMRRALTVITDELKKQLPKKKAKAKKR